MEGEVGGVGFSNQLSAPVTKTKMAIHM